MPKKDTQRIHSELLAILESTQAMGEVLSSEPLDLKHFRNLSESRAQQMANFQRDYQHLFAQKASSNPMLDSFTNIYKVLIKKQRELDDTLHRRLSAIRTELNAMKIERNQRSRYLKSNAANRHDHSVLITSKLQG